MTFQSFLTFGTCLRATRTRRRATRPVCARPHEFWDQKTSRGHISLKTCPNGAFEVLFGIYICYRCQKTPQTPDLDKFWVRYGLPKFSDFYDPSARDQDPSVPAHMSFETKKLLEAISHLKLVRMGAFEVFFGIYICCRCQKNTSNARFRQVLSEIWPSKVFWLFGPVYARPRPVVARHDPSAPAHMSFETKNLWRPYLTQNLSELDVWGVFWHLHFL